jgi:hypothetical protein
MAKNVPDRWLNRFVMNQARFAVGEVAATPGAADRLTVKELNELVARHERGDWGLVDFEEQQANERALDEGGELRSVYVASDGTPFQVLTTADRSTTTVSLLKVFETFSNDDDTDQPQRSGSRDEPVATTVEVNEPSYFGGCPECGKNDGYLNVGRTHWFICHAHRTRWWGGENLFSCWRGQNESEWQENVERLRPYAKVKPLMGDATARRKPVAWKEESGPTSKTSCVGCGSQDGD